MEVQARRKTAVLVRGVRLPLLKILTVDGVVLSTLLREAVGASGRLLHVGVDSVGSGQTIEGVLVNAVASVRRQAGHLRGGIAPLLILELRDEVAQSLEHEVFRVIG